MLNARRHRSGEQALIAALPALIEECSTPEGIGAANNAKGRAAFVLADVCSTPEGIGAANNPGLL